MLEQSPAVTSAKQDIVDELLKDLPSDAAIEVDLPSECRVNELIDKDLPVTIRPMTFEDEKQIISSKGDEDPVNIVLQRCVSNLKVGELLPMDKLYLVMKLREISYGDDYNCLLICEHCKAENPTIVKLSQLNVNPVPDDFVDPIEVKLDSINKSANVRLPRVKDEKFLGDAADSLNQIWRFVVDIDGHSDKSVIAAVVDKLPLRDIRKIMNALKGEYGVDTNIKFQCGTCGGVTVVDLPINANFFDVN
jgi:hypothetical protein